MAACFTMLSLKPPAPERLHGWLKSWSEEPLSYTPPLADGFIADEHAVRLGSGDAVYRIWTRSGFVISGASPFVAMFLALSFGIRYLIPNYALTMPQMWAIHGTLNAFGFGMCGLQAWRCVVTPAGCP